MCTCLYVWLISYNIHTLCCYLLPADKNTKKRLLSFCLGGATSACCDRWAMAVAAHELAITTKDHASPPSY